jgi:CysZ protein
VAKYQARKILSTMRGIGPSITFALANLLHPRMLWLMLWPVLVAAGLWGAAAIWSWAGLVAWLAGVLRDWIETATFFVQWDASTVALIAAKVLVILCLLPLIQLTALLILGVFGMPAMVDHVARRAFPALARRHGGSFAGSVWNSVVGVVGLVLLGALSIPFWFFPPLWPAIPVAILGWVNQRVLRYDALAEHATALEMKTVFSRRRAAMYLLGVVLALAAYIPVIGLFAPVLFGLAFIHFLLTELQVLRTEPIEATAVPQ